MKPMRMLVLLAVFWAAGSLLLAAESPPSPTPAPQPAAAAKAQEPAKEAKQDEARHKATIAEQAEAALKAAAAADAGSAKEPAKGEDAAKDDTQLPPPSSGSSAKGPSPQRFVPTEQVRADFDVSFPIDI